MTTLGELIVVVQNIINGQLLSKSVFDHANSSSSITASDIRNYLNRAVRHIATGIRVPGLSVVTRPLPDLFTIGTVDTSVDSFVSLPDNYGREVQFVANSDHVEIERYDTFGELSRIYPNINDAGSVNAVAIKGSVLHYRKLPDTPETLTIHYYRQPVDMSEHTDEPDGVPSHLQEDLLCNYAMVEVIKRLHDLPPQSLAMYNDLLSDAVRALDSWSITDTESIFLL